MSLVKNSFLLFKFFYYIFGSRVSDSNKGGDIDLFISNKNKQNLTLSAKINFLVELKSKIGEQKIDVVLDTEATRSKKSFYQSRYFWILYNTIIKYWKF